MKVALYPSKRAVDDTVATIAVGFAYRSVGAKIEVTFLEVDPPNAQNKQADRKLSTQAGRVGIATDWPGSRAFIPVAPPPPAPQPAPGKAYVAFRFATPGKPRGGKLPMPIYVLEIPADKLHLDEGKGWWFAVSVKLVATGEEVRSQSIHVAYVRRQIGADRATYDWHDGHDVELYHDGSIDPHGSAGAFKDILDAIDQAQHFVFVVDWSFQPLARLSRGGAVDYKDSIGAKLINKAASNDKFVVAIHTWAHTDIGAPDAENDDGKAVLERIARGLGKKNLPAGLYWRATSREGIGFSHHQKFVAVDCPGDNGKRDILVFWGGLDLTKGRFDWPKHFVSELDGDTAVFTPSWGTPDGKWTTDDWYNAEMTDEKAPARGSRLPRQPWHDIHAKVKGAAAWDFVREFVGRWCRVPSIGGNDGDTGSGAIGALWRWYSDARTTDKLVQQSVPRKGGFSLQVYRSQTQAHWAPPGWLDRPNLPQGRPDPSPEFKWSLAGSTELSIQEAYRQAIAQAERFIYIENQYFIGSGNRWGRDGVRNDIPERIVNRILERVKDGKDFHAYIVMPMLPEGKPADGGILEVRRYSWLTMEYMATTLASKLPEDKAWYEYVSFYFLANWRDTPSAKWVTDGDRAKRLRAHQRYMVYVHSKMMIVDDRYVILGSANLNERSQAGDRDSEIACGIWPSLGHEPKGAQKIKDFRKSLWAEHLGKAADSEDTPESPACSASVRKIAKDNYVAFRHMNAPTGLICRLPFLIRDQKFGIDTGVGDAGPDEPKYIPDPQKKNGDWNWKSPGSMLRVSSVAE